MDDLGIQDGSYQRLKTYRCDVLDGEACPGYEPEPEAAAEYRIPAVDWFDLRERANWPDTVLTDPITFPLLQRIRTALGYADRRTRDEDDTASGAEPTQASAS